MGRAMEAAAVLAQRARVWRRPKPTDLRFAVRFRVLPDEEALRRLPHFEADRPLEPDPDPEDGSVYAPYASDGGLGLIGETARLGGRPLRRGDLVKMEIRAEGKAARIRCLGQVAWVRMDHAAGLFRAGVGFVGVDRRDLSPG